MINYEKSGYNCYQIYMSINFNTNIYIAGHTGMAGSSTAKAKSSRLSNLIMRKHLN